MSREKILQAIRRSKPEKPSPLPDIPRFEHQSKDLRKAFTLVSEGSGSTVLTPGAQSLTTILNGLFPGAGIIYSRVKEVESQGLSEDYPTQPHQLEAVDLAVVRGRLGVAENGAIWVTEKALGVRVSAFITQHLIVLLDPATLVWNMHEAYERIEIDETGFGVFIAGPSKTADIEQSLVIGAQAARSLTVIFNESPAPAER